MPEFPDIEVYVACLRTRLIGEKLREIRLRNPFLLRSVSPAIEEMKGRQVRAIRRMGKRIVFGLEGEHFLVLHLMIAGRLRWRDPGAKIPLRFGAAALDFEKGTVLVTEAGSKKRASLHCVRGKEKLREHDPGGLEILETTCGEFKKVLKRHNHTLKRALTDPRIFSGIGNAYSDELLHRARISPFKQTRHLKDPEVRRLFEACRGTLSEWRDRLLQEVGSGFPEKVTAFRKGMAVHGRHRQPCPECGAPIQRIVYASNESNYCAPCQTGGKLLADRALSRLLRDDWPKTLEELEARKGAARQ